MPIAEVRELGSDAYWWQRARGRFRAFQRPSLAVSMRHTPTLPPQVWPPGEMCDGLTARPLASPEEYRITAMQRATDVQVLRSDAVLCSWPCTSYYLHAPFHRCNMQLWDDNRVWSKKDVSCLVRCRRVERPLGWPGCSPPFADEKRGPRAKKQNPLRRSRARYRRSALFSWTCVFLNLAVVARYPAGVPVTPRTPLIEH